MNLKRLAEIARRRGLSPMLHENHRLPMNRRDLVAQGFLAGTSYVVTPSLLSMWATRAKADGDCGPAKSFDVDPFGMRIMAFEAAGGGNLAGSNFMVFPGGGLGGDKLVAVTGLGTLGLPASQARMDPNMDFGIPMHPNSAILAGMTAATTPACRARVSGFVECVSSADDSNRNPFSLAYWAAKAGSTGSLTNIIGSETTAHGARSDAPPESVITMSSTQVRSYSQAADLVTAANLETALPGKVGSVLKAATALSDSRLRMLANEEMPEQVRQLGVCSFESARDAVASGLGDQVDASQDAAFLAELAAITDANVRGFTIDRTAAGLESTLAPIYLLLKGYAAFATQVMGGFDYHNNPRATTNQRDFDLGFRVGTCLQAAHIQGSALAVVINTDGGVGCSDPNTPDDPNNAVNPAGGQGMFTSDRGEGGLMVVLAYGPRGRAPIINPAHQVGAFNDSGAVDHDYELGKVISNSPTNAIQCALMNILALHGRLGDLAGVIGENNPFADESVRDAHLIFGPWPT